MKRFLPIHTFRLQGSIPRLLLFSFLAVSFFVWIIYQNNKDAETTAFWVNHTDNVIKQIKEVNTLVAETESATRSYMVTGEKEWGKQLHILHRQLDQTVADIRVLTSDNPQQLPNIRELQSFVNDKKDLQNSIIEAPQLDPVQARKITFNGRAPAITLSIKGTLAKMLQNENDLLAERVAKNKKYSRNSFYIALIGGTSGFMLIVIILLQLNKDISRRKAAEENAYTSEAKYRNLIENAGAAMYTADIGGHITFASSKTTQLTGHSPAELNNRHFSSLVEPAWLEKVTDTYIDQLKNRTQETNIEFPIITHTGEIKWVEQSAVLLYEKESIVGFQCIVKDISERKQMQLNLEIKDLQLKENQYRLQSIMDNAPLIIYLKDLEGHYVVVNNKFKELLQFDDTIIGKTAFEVVKDKEATERRRKKDLIVISTKKPLQMEESVETSDGIRHFSVMKFPLMDERGEVFGVCSIATDLTDTVNYQRQLIEARKVAEDAKKMEELFLANMSHEIRTPMNGIQGMTDLLMETPLNDKQREFTRIIKHSADNLLVIINDILDLSKIRAGKLTIEKIDFKLTETADNIKAFFKHKLDKKRLALEIQIDKDIPPVLTGDPYRLNQVLVNLIGNAIKFTETGHIHVNILLLDKTENEVQLKFIIEDTGIGIPEDKMHLIFGDFSQAGPDITRRYGGTGLGLAICKQLLKIQGGDISVESSINKGTRFSFTISYAYNNETKTIPLAPDDTIDYTSLLTGKQFLVAEDNEINQRLIAYVLEKVGANVDIASNGREAINNLRDGKTYDLIIMDLQMPEMDGYETTQHLRQEMQISTPILAMTATALKGEKLKCLESGMNDYMSKPFEFTDLYKRIIRLIGTFAPISSIPGSSPLLP
ncbi:MAG TPA: PAS domain S-box protein [Puia sp.]|nr:PAS domain S-box protein [Puia sp.]